MTKSILAPCPKCGAAGAICYRGSRMMETLYGIRCPACGYRGKTIDPVELAAKTWNLSAIHMPRVKA